MADELRSCFVSYFTQLEKVHGKWKELLQESEIPTKILVNQVEQYRHVINIKEHEIQNIMDPETKERLLFSVLMNIQEKLMVLSDIITQINNVVQDLKNYLKNVEKAMNQICLEQIPSISETYYYGNLNFLLKWSIDSYQYLRMNNCLNVVDFKEQKSIDNLNASFVEDKYNKQSIEEILKCAKDFCT